LVSLNFPFRSCSLPRTFIWSLAGSPSHIFRDFHKIWWFLCRIHREIPSGQTHDSK
jgi:hypothetical protein